MWTQVSHGQLVNDIVTKIGVELDINFERPSTAAAFRYQNGKWLYSEHGSQLDTRVSRWGTGANRIVKGPTWDESENAYRERLNKELGEAVNELMMVESND